MAKQNLGMVTAYAYAVVGGYEGTEAEFEALLGNIATDLAEIENLTVIANTLPPGSQATASYDHGVLTLGIPKGDKGDTGAGATVTAGTTATGNPGTNASVINSGTTKDAVFNFTIPRGDTGNGIESIELTDTQGAVKTYTILFTDGNTTTFDVTDGEVTNATLTAVLADYAKIDGAYESMTVGNAEQLVSSIFEEDSVPYNFRTSGGSIDIGDRETDMLVGGTVAWNQLVPNGNFDEIGSWFSSGGSLSIANNVVTMTPAFESGGYSNIAQSGASNNAKIISGHKYLYSVDIKSDAWASSGNAVVIAFGGFWVSPLPASRLSTSAWNTVSSVYAAPSNASIIIEARKYYESSMATMQARNVVLFDLTAMFGSTIADYISSLEQANAGAGVAWFRKLFPKPYYAYNAGELMSVQAVSHDMVGFNQWDEEWESGAISASTGNTSANANYSRSKNFCKILPNTTYYRGSASITNFGMFFYDADKNYIGVNYYSTPQVFTTPSNASYFKVHWEGTTYNHDICINLSWDGERDGEYEEYVKHSYPLDSDLILRGIPKLDASNNLYYDGDTYESDGSVTRKYGIVDLGTLTWVYEPEVQRFYALNLQNVIKKPSTSSVKTNVICDKYVTVSFDGPTSLYSGVNKCCAVSSGGSVNVRDESYTDAATLKTAMSGVYLVYELATPTTESADPYTNPQIVNDFGTEEYVDYAVSQGDRDVSIPVGHYTQYMANLKAKLEMSPNSPEGAGDYIVRQTNGENEYVTLASNATIQDIIARLEALEGGGE